MSWLWPTFVNPDLGLTRQERKEIHRAAWKLWFANWRNIVVYSMLLVSYVALIVFDDDLVAIVAAATGAGAGVQQAIRVACPIVWCVLVFVVGGAVLQRLWFAPCVYRALRQRGHDVCAGCGYWLKGLGGETKHCPECGNSIEAS